MNAKDISPTAAAGLGTTFYRHIFYIHGFDPRGPAVYHRFCKLSASARAALSPEQMHVSPRKKASTISDSWTIQANHSNGNTLTTYEILRWDDAVRKFWARKPRASLPFAAWRALQVFRKQRILAVLHRQARACYRSIVLQGIFTPLFGVGVLLCLATAFLLSLVVGGILGVPVWAYWVLPVLVLVASRWAWHRFEAWLNLNWVTRGLSFIIESAHGEVDPPQAHWEAFAQRIATIQNSEQADEVIVVGHSIGALIGVRALAHWRTLAPPLQGGMPKIKFMTLGQSIPLYTLLKSDQSFADALSTVAQCRAIEWLDVTSGSDPASTCGLDPLAGVETGTTLHRQSPDFHLTLTPSHFREIRTRPLDFHFQYLKATDTPIGFDYMRMICAPTQTNW